jgi:hypothetical protein
MNDASVHCGLSLPMSVILVSQVFCQINTVYITCTVMQWNPELTYNGLASTSDPEGTHCSADIDIQCTEMSKIQRRVPSRHRGETRRVYPRRWRLAGVGNCLLRPGRLSWHIT